MRQIKRFSNERRDAFESIRLFSGLAFSGSQEASLDPSPRVIRMHLEGAVYSVGGKDVRKPDDLGVDFGHEIDLGVSPCLDALPHFIDSLLRNWRTPALRDLFRIVRRAELGDEGGETDRMQCANNSRGGDAEIVVPSTREVIREHLFTIYNRWNCQL